MTDLIILKPIGCVHNSFINPKEAKLYVESSTIEIFPEYTDALQRLTEHSHIWVLGWFHEARRDILKIVPRINKELPEYGVFGLRTFSRPNPIGLSVVKLEKVQDNILTVSDLDFIDGTPVLDIKPYYEQDIIFAPDTPYIRPANPDLTEEIMMKQAFNHHQEKCEQMMLAVKMALIAERELGKLTAKDIRINVSGSRCLADTLQGLTRAKLANPQRFSFEETEDKAETVWENEKAVIKITSKTDLNPNSISELPSDMFFEVEIIRR